MSMPKHTRDASGSRGPYGGQQLNHSLGSSFMYGQQRMAAPTNYYAIPSSSTSSSMPTLPPQQQQQQQQQQQPQQPQQQHQKPQQQQTDYDSYPSEPLALPPAQYRASSGAWSLQNDQQLIAARMQGLNWGQIKESYFPSKTPNACRKRHERLMERKGADNWDNRKLQRMAKEYMSMRKEIWSGLEARTGEKWTVVEQKCMSSGLKNLQSVARVASRRERIETGSHATGYDDNSGISSIGLTPVDELDASFNSPEMSSSNPPSFSSSESVGYSFQSHPHQRAPPGSSYVMAAGRCAAGPGVAAYGGHGYSSSVSSTASAARRQRFPAPAHPASGRESSIPYLDAQRMSSGDMGIDAIINRPGGGYRPA